MDIRVETVAPMRVVFVRNLGPYTSCGQAWGRLCGWAGPRGLMGPQAKMLGVAYDDPRTTPEDKIRYDACLTIGPGVQGEGEFGVKEIGGGLYAIARHVGPYEQLSKTYEHVIHTWIPANGKSPRDAGCIEHYINSPMTVPPDQLLTDVHVPISG